MHNQLTQRVADHSRYFAIGELDDCTTSVITLNESIILGFGLVSIGLSHEAAAELAAHLVAALNADGGVQ